MTVHVTPFRQSLPLRVPEWIMAAMMLHWGWNVLSNPEMFSLSPSFDGMTKLWSQAIWGQLAMALGLIGLVGLAINGHWRPTPAIRGASSFGRMLLWLQIWVGFIAAGSPTTGTTIYLGLTLLEFWNIYRAGGDLALALK